MSLIEEALRRAKDPLVPPATTKPQPPQKASPSQAPPTAHSWPMRAAASPSQPVFASPASPLTLVSLAILGLTIALLVGGASWLWRTRNGRLSMAAKPESASRPEPIASSKTPARVSTDGHQEFSLTGVVEGLGEPYAVINGSIVAVGETIGEATLLDISDGTVRLRLADGNDAVLRVER